MKNKFNSKHNHKNANPNNSKMKGYDFMKKTNKFAAFALAACMMAPMTMATTASFTASAADNYSITIGTNGSVNASKHSFNAYQIFTGTLNSGESGFTGGSVQWGSAITDNGATFIDALKGNVKLKTITDVANLTAASTAYDVALALEKVNTTELINELANVINGIIGSTTTSAGTYDGSGTTAVIENLVAGYYFVKDVTAIGEGDAQSKFILKLLKNETVTIKTDAPTLEKKIWHNDTAAAPSFFDKAPTESNWGDVGDNQIGDTVYYYIKTSVPDMKDYDTYKYIIRDTFSEGLTFNEVTNIVYVTSGGDTVDLTKLSSSMPTVNSGDDDSTAEIETFYISFVDLKKTLESAGITRTSGDMIYTYYNATLNKNALVSNSKNDTQNNPNTAWLEYSNNPNQSGSGDTNNTGETPKDTVYEWTYTFEAEKVDEKNNPLGNAKFSLKSGTDIINLIEITDINELKVNGITDLDENTMYYRKALSGESGKTTIETTNKKNKFMFVGLDDAKTYTLEETSAPDNYTKAADTELSISDMYNVAGNELTEISRKVGSNTADKATIINKKGTTLPSTGGIGTTIFYVLGGTLVVGSGIALVTKKRLGKNED